MCFRTYIIKGSSHLQAKVATRPIRVLKTGRIYNNIFVKECFSSTVYPKLYAPNTIYTQEPIVPSILYTGPYTQDILEINRGFHSYRRFGIEITSEKDWDFFIGPYDVGIFEIPKGSIYYSDDYFFVSDSIKLIKVIDSFEEWVKEDFKPESIL